MRADFEMPIKFAQNGSNGFVSLNSSYGDSDVLRPEKCNAVSLEWKDITYEVPDGKEHKTLISQVYGRCAPGTLTAIMGPSGAGKTTLLNILSGHYDTGYRGEVHVNGCLRDTKLFNMQSCYVMQDDCLLPELSVREALTMSVQLRTPSLSSSKRKEIVDDAILRWGLEACENTRANCLSGGQRKRLAISQELISNPPVIFLDEPTSGLDSSSALRCVLVLKSLAACGHTVLCSIHNPSATLFSHFDKLYMISDGMCIYNGPVDKLLPFLSAQNLHCPIHHNPSDFITEIASGEHGELSKQLARSFRPGFVVANGEGSFDHPELTPYGGRVMTEAEKGEERQRYQVKANACFQFGVLLKRCFLCIIRNKVASQLRILAYIFFSVLLTMMYYDIGNKATRVLNNAALFVVTLAIILFQSIMPTVLIFPTELTVLLREHRNCWYSPSMYFIARIITELPFTIGGPFIMMFVVHWTTSQPPEFIRVASVIILAVQTCSTSQALALVVSAASNIQTALFVALPAAAPSFLFCGYFVQVQHLHPAFAWITYTSHVYHAHQGMLHAIYGYGREELECEDNSFCFLSDPQEILHKLDAQHAYLSVKFAILLSMDFILKAIAFMVLKWRLRRKR